MSMDIRGVCTLLQVFDMPTSIRFYRDVLGFEVVHKSMGEGDDFDWCLLRLNEVDLMLNTAYDREDRPVERDKARVAAHRDTGLYFSCPDVDGAFHHLIAQGIKAKEPKTAPYGMKQLRVRDPDGYELCFQFPAE